MKLNISCTLNGGSGSVTLYHDSTGDGSANENETLSLVDGSSEYDFTTVNSSSGDNYWVEFDLTAGNYETTPVVDSATYVAPPVTKEWQTATDWDNSQSESGGIVHDSYSDYLNSQVTLGYRQAILSGLDVRGYWPLHETSGTTANDFSGNNNNATYDGPTLGSQGPVTNAASFDNTDDTIDIGSSTTLNSNGWSNCTIGAWCYHDSSTGRGFIYESGSFNHYLWINGNGYLQFRLYDGASDHIINNNTFPEDTWFHAIGTYNGSTQYLYIDAVEAGTSSWSGTLYDEDAYKTIGSHAGGPYWWGGNLAEVFVANDYVTASQVQELYDMVTTGSMQTVIK